MIIGLILAGGRSRRFGSAKHRAELAGTSLGGWVAARARPQVAELLVSAVEEPEAELRGLIAVADAVPGFRGPLAGLLAGLEWIALNRPQARRCASFAVDAPFLPRDLVARLAGAADDATPAVAASGGRIHPVAGLWPVSLAPRLRRYLIEDGRSDVTGFAETSGARPVEFATEPFDPFFNINRPEDLEEAERICRRFDLAAP